MALIKHKFGNHQINPKTETLVIGTFNPDSEHNPAEFFYGRAKNYLWRLLPTAFNHEDLKGKPTNEKMIFIEANKIDFIDLIAEVNVEDEVNYEDGYLDSRVLKWRDIISELERLKAIKRVCFSRKTFSDIPQMRIQIEKVREFCGRKNIKFEYLVTPSRFYREDKQAEWTRFLIG